MLNYMNTYIVGAPTFWSAAACRRFRMRLSAGWHESQRYNASTEEPHCRFRNARATRLPICGHLHL
jgi:hypothetical protein